MNHAGHIGPNAVIRLAEALDALESRAVTVRLFNAAELGRYLIAPPAAMLPEEEVTRLHRQLRGQLGAVRATSVSWVAGQRTADYLLDNRIPKPVQRLLKLLPQRLAAFILLKSIGSHAWTFAGSGRFSWAMTQPIRLRFENCALCREDHAAAPCCQYYAATFERLFRALIDADAKVTETRCIAKGDDACCFEIT
ncbi:bacteriochlorophyll 4-vinyl reductase [Aestuariivirga sp.]|uniref:bacteriochlorophyll 4-vinyl reductase n=1 Tax=Aestuariivirga sp. TaxID=2650926 RepID=UPI003BAADAD5